MKVEPFTKLVGQYRIMLPQLEQQAMETTLALDKIMREMEGIKVKSLRQALIKAKMLLSLEKGAMIAWDKKQIGRNLGLAGFEVVLMALFTQDSTRVVAGGLDTFNNLMRSYDESNYSVWFSGKIKVVRSDSRVIAKGDIYWQKMMEILDILADETESGEKLGDLTSVIEEIKQLSKC